MSAAPEGARTRVARQAQLRSERPEIRTFPSGLFMLAEHARSWRGHATLVRRFPGSSGMLILFTMFNTRGLAFGNLYAVSTSAKLFDVSGQERTVLLDQDGGARRDRTDDLMLAKHALSQLSYGPIS